MSHVNMVDISDKDNVLRIATAEGRIKLRKRTVERILNNTVEKGDIVSISEVVGISGAKKTSELLPFCHPIPITKVSVKVAPDSNNREIVVRATVKGIYKTGVEMEALTAVALALLNIWDMVKKYEKDDRGEYPFTEISKIRVIEKKKIKLNQQ